MTPGRTNELPSIPGGWMTRDFVLAGKALRVTLPASPDAFLDDAEVLAANRRDDYMPYWSYLWPTSLETAVAVLTHDWHEELACGTASNRPVGAASEEPNSILPPLRKGGAGGGGSSATQTRQSISTATQSDTSCTSPERHSATPRDACATHPLRRGGTTGPSDGSGDLLTGRDGNPSCETIQALEIGAGIALTGLAALTRGMQVTFSDYDQRAIDLALFNARENHLDYNAEGLLLDWRHPLDRRFPLIFGCDVIYEAQNHRPILALLEKMLAKEGRCWITDPGRYHADAFVDLLAESPFHARHQTLVREPYPGRPAGTTNLWVLTWK